MSSYEHVVEVLMDPARFSSASGVGVPAGPNGQHPPDPNARLATMLSADPPVHSHYRTLVNKTFSVRRIAACLLVRHPSQQRPQPPCVQPGHPLLRRRAARPPQGPCRVRGAPRAAGGHGPRAGPQRPAGRPELHAPRAARTLDPLPPGLRRLREEHRVEPFVEGSCSGEVAVGVMGVFGSAIDMVDVDGFLGRPAVS